MRYKAERFEVMGMERYFVIPKDKDIFELVDPNSLKIGDDVLCQASTWQGALKIAFAMNLAFQKGEQPNG